MSAAKAMLTAPIIAAAAATMDLKNIGASLPENYGRIADFLPWRGCAKLREIHSAPSAGLYDARANFM
jgi:hypothetical protein